MNVIINGASGGIGREVAKIMAGDVNNRILATGRNVRALEELFLEHPSKNLIPMKLDLSSLDRDAKKVKGEIENLLGKVDILINIAGALVVKGYMDTSPEEEKYMMQVNYFGPSTLIRLIVPLMPPGSHIVNISSMGGFQGSSKYKGLASYSASKAAISCLSECLAGELSDRGISVNCLALGAVDTAMFREAFPGLTAPLSPAKMAGFITEFALGGNRFFNGKVLPVAVTNP